MTNKKGKGKGGKQIPFGDDNKKSKGKSERLRWKRSPL